MKKAKMILMSILLVFTFSMLAGCGTKDGRKAADETKKSTDDKAVEDNATEDNAADKKDKDKKSRNGHNDLFLFMETVREEVRQRECVHGDGIPAQPLRHDQPV